jgi:hypothetical protein
MNKSKKIRIRYEKLLGKKQCNPKIKNKTKHCIPDSVLLSSINSSKRNKTRRDIAKELGCNSNSERCIIEKAHIPSDKKDLLEDFLRPKMPNEWKNDPDQWLDNRNIENVLTQYEEARNDFKFLGVHPIDFAIPNPYDNSKKDTCLIPTMCNVSVPMLRNKGIRYVGVVFNLDPHTKSGSHWVACFIDTKINWVYYFDSYGMVPPRDIYLFMKSLLIDEPRMQLAYNARRFQFGNSECGMYSIYFIICMLNGAKFKEFVHRRVPDDVMLQLRKWFFSS